MWAAPTGVVASGSHRESRFSQGHTLLRIFTYAESCYFQDRLTGACMSGRINGVVVKDGLTAGSFLGRATRILSGAFRGKAQYGPLARR